MNSIYDIEGIVETRHDAEHGVVYVKWHRFGGHDHLRPSIEAQVACVRDGAKAVIVDVSEARGVPSKEDQAWFGEVVFPAYKEADLQALINVQPKSAITRLGAAKWSKTASGFGFDIVDCVDADQAWELAIGYAQGEITKVA